MRVHFPNLVKPSADASNIVQLDPSLAPRYHVAFFVSYMASRAMLLQANDRILEIGCVAVDTWVRCLNWSKM